MYHYNEVMKTVTSNESYSIDKIRVHHEAMCKVVPATNTEGDSGWG